MKYKQKTDLHITNVVRTKAKIIRLIKNKGTSPIVEWAGQSVEKPGLLIGIDRVSRQTEGPTEMVGPKFYAGCSV